MREALSVAEASAEAGEVPVGALLVKGDRIVARSGNRMEELRDVSAHAEILALREGAKALGDWRLPECDLYVTLEPCIMCTGALILSRVRTVYFGAFDPRLGALGSQFDLAGCPSLPHQPRVVSGVLAQDSLELLSRFFKGLRKATNL